ncbi:MAG: HAD family hydrolase [Nocardioides sp.]|nr:HAD family hydrolase [Nocardioides sp.]
MLFDFGGVLTSSVLRGFADASEQLTRRAQGGPDRGLLLRLLGHEPRAKAALVDHEEGRLDDEDFEAVLAASLAEAGVAVPAAGLIPLLQTHLRPDQDSVALVHDVRALGVPVGLVSNSFGRDCYAGFDLDALFDARAISGVEGVRKPSRRLYEIGCERLGVDPAHAVMVDDLAQNVEAAARLGMGGVVHRDATTTREALGLLLGRDLTPVDSPTTPGPARR